jgi:predicted nucleic acid-binding protein
VIVLDTSVVSEAMKPEPHASVRDWFDAQAAETLFLCCITVAEIMFGMGGLPRGTRKERLAAAFDGVLAVFAPRILPFDGEAARRYADLAVRARARGRGFPTPDGYIAAIAASHEFAVASRDTSAFAAAGLKVFDPWKLPDPPEGNRARPRA